MISTGDKKEGRSVRFMTPPTAKANAGLEGAPSPDVELLRFLLGLRPWGPSLEAHHAYPAHHTRRESCGSAQQIVDCNARGAACGLMTSCRTHQLTSRRLRAADDQPSCSTYRSALR